VSRCPCSKLRSAEKPRDLHAAVIGGSFVHGWHGLWLLIGAPLALPEARAALSELLVITVFLFTGDAF
jgi:hypothetical protein